MEDNMMAMVAAMEKVKHLYPEHMKTVRKIAAEGMVLLRNENGVLPLREKKAALFGAGAVDTVYCGTGSGFVTAPYVVNVRKGLEEAGVELTSAAWLDRFEQESKKANEEDTTLSPIDRIWSGLTVMIDDLPITEEELAAAGGADTAIYVVRRNSGENADRKAEKGDYYLTDQEEENLRRVSEAFAHTVVVLNTCAMDTGFLDRISGIDALVLMGLAGNECGGALADILTGKVSPSGKLTDTWAMAYADYPAAETFGANGGNALQQDYREDIFVGYRYFDTFAIKPRYPFGFGLSYTSFELEVTRVAADWDTVTVEIRVTNTGAASGKEVVQIYVSAPETGLPKPVKELKGFAKTGELAPGGSELLTVVIPTESLASYCEEKAAFVMEAGEYVLLAGNSSDAVKAAAVLSLDAGAVLRQVRNEVQPDHALDIIRVPERKRKIPGGVPVLTLHAADCRTATAGAAAGCETAGESMTAAVSGGTGGENGAAAAPDGTAGENGAAAAPDGTVGENVAAAVPGGAAEGNRAAAAPGGVAGGNRAAAAPGRTDAESMVVAHATLPDVKEGRVSMGAFVASLEDEVLVRLVTGNAEETPYETEPRVSGGRQYHPCTGPKSSGATTDLFVSSLGIPNWLLTDGPAGLHLPLCESTCNPVGTVLAQTWDIAAVEDIGRQASKELSAYNYSVLLGPGMNIHRDPLCGRNFEYFSEDPLLTGRMGAAFTRGAQSQEGTAVSIKHFACNNQETDRTDMNATVSERALREIYLRGFEICVKEAKPRTVMTSYNLLNGIHTSSHVSLLTNVLRGEWEFDGLVMTDWGSKSDKACDLHAGNDLIMGGYRTQTLIAAMQGLAPEFAEDGYVKTEVFEVFGGFMKQVVEHWNVFAPCADGKDTVTAAVRPGAELNEKVRELAERGIAEVTEQADGSRTVTYRGTDRGAYLSRGDVRACAARVLKELMNSVSYRVMTEETAE